MTSGEHINTVVKKTRDVIILMTEEILVVTTTYPMINDSIGQ